LLLSQKDKELVHVERKKKEKNANAQSPCRPFVPDPCKRGRVVRANNVIQITISKKEKKELDTSLTTLPTTFFSFFVSFFAFPV